MIHLINITILTLICGGLSAGLILVAEKWNLINKYELRRRPWMPEQCEFCLCFWLSIGILTGLIIAFLPGELTLFKKFVYYGIIPLSAAAFARSLL